MSLSRSEALKHYLFGASLHCMPACLTPSAFLDKSNDQRGSYICVSIRDGHHPGTPERSYSTSSQATHRG